MPRIRVISLCALTALGTLVSTGFISKAAPGRQDGITLMATAAVWKYPDSTMLGASMSDGGNPAEPEDLACKAVFATPDPFDDVVKYFTQRTSEGAGIDKDTQSVMIQEDSKDRPIKLQIFSIHRADRSNILVISRGENEKKTHIAWSQYRRTFRK